MKTTIYICADSTLTYGPLGGRDKVIKQALPVAIVGSEEDARSVIVRFGRLGYDVAEADPRFEQARKGKPIAPGYGPERRYYWSGPEFVRNDVSTVFDVRKRLESEPEVLDD